MKEKERFCVSIKEAQGGYTVSRWPCDVEGIAVTLQDALEMAREFMQTGPLALGQEQQEDALRKATP